MCGICGQIGGRLENERPGRALAKMVHRGPNQHGVKHLPDGFLGHRRLSILDLSEAGRQPMTNEDGSIWLTFNGEIYNFAELRTMLEKHHRFASKTDSEVLVHGYEHWGIDGLLNRVRGMFAFGLWDARKGVLYLARDHIGKKPLYYTSSEGSLRFASTLPALLELLDGVPAVSAVAIADYLTYMHIPPPRTIFEGVLKLPPAHWLEFRIGGDAKLVRYWRPEFKDKIHLREEEYLYRLEELLKDAVRERLVADVRVGALLSGGVDSSLIVRLMSEASSKPVPTFSIGFEEQKFNELPHAKKVAQVCGTEHHEFVLRSNVAEILPQLIFHYGEPFGDHSALATYYVSQVAKSRVSVVLTGDGGDENFAGYSVTLAGYLADHLRQITPNSLRTFLAAALRRFESSGVHQVRPLRWVAELATGSDPRYVFDPVGSRTFRFFDKEFMHRDFRERTVAHDGDRWYAELLKDAGDVGSVNRGLYVDLLGYLPGDLLVKTDVATMAHSLEARSPLLDLRVIEFAAQIPPAAKLRRWQTKYLLKKLAAKHLPHEMIYRRKQGFALPVSAWLREDLGHILETVLLSPAALNRNLFALDRVKNLIGEHRSGKRDHGQRLWLLLLLEMWFLMFIDKQITVDDDLSAIEPIERRSPQAA